VSDRTKPQTYGVSYMSRALDDVNGVIRDMRKALAGVKYDTIVVTGSSGMMIGPILARALRKKVFVVRKKPEYESSHSHCAFLGTLGHRWVFVDDFISSGETFRRVRDGIREVVKETNTPLQRYNYDTGRYEPDPSDLGDEFVTECVGFFEYQFDQANDNGGFTKWDEFVPRFESRLWDDSPYALAQRKRREEAAVAADSVKYERIVADADAKREAEIDAAVETVPNSGLSVTVTLPTLEEYNARLQQITTRVSCGLLDCDICQAEARSLVEAEYGLGKLNPNELQAALS